MNSSRTNNLIIALVIIAVIGGAYLFYQKNVSETALQAAPPVTTGSESSFVSLVGELSSVSLDPAILTDPRFTALTDMSTAVVPEPAGRRDPFAPIPGVSSDTSGTQTVPSTQTASADQTAASTQSTQ